MCSVVYGYGRDQDLLEISGLMTKEEYARTGDTVLGHLAPEDVFERIRKHYHANK